MSRDFLNDEQASSAANNTANRSNSSLRSTTESANNPSPRATAATTAADRTANSVPTMTSSRPLTASGSDSGRMMDDRNSVRGVMPESAAADNVSNADAATAFYSVPTETSNIEVKRP